ncbi:Hypothetical predicted protein [Paramuricea clavata]|uniref:Uncharacterized protein n=1 Tax=Paramuricea clavata TaxID=317549 RepID=A0A6S7IQX7_PARCT|nr:Hypothetical predicted protein [Paramuricea clavata]
MDTIISDHLPVYAVLNMKLPKPLPQYILTRSYKDYDGERFTGHLASRSQELISIFSDSNVNSKLDNFNNVLLTTLAVHAPVRITKIQNRSCPFITTDIKNQMFHSDQLHRRYKRQQKRAAETAEVLALQNNLNISTELEPQNRRSELFSTELLKFTPVTCTEVERIITTMPSNKSPGPDKISMRIIKDCLPVILGPLTDIMNNSFTTSVFPKSWKIAEIIPPLKEAVFLNCTDRLSSQQSGNKKFHSTEQLSILVNDFLLKSIDNKNLTALVLLDPYKVFDSVDHSILLKKLSNIGVLGEALNWFESYITDRKQFVCIGSSISEVLPITNGVPQGAILSPLLFCIYINDLSRVPQASELESFVDHSKIFMSFPIEDIARAKTKIEEDLKLLAGFEGDNLNNNLISDSTPDTVEILQNIFTKPWSKLPETIIPSLEDVASSLRQENPPTPSIGQVKTALKQLNPKKATGSDGIPAWVLKRYCEELAPIVHDIICASIKECEYPTAYKHALVIPVPKVNPPRDIENDFRQISILPQMAKVLEKLQLKLNLPSSRINDNQHAFTSKRSTVSALTNISQNWFIVTDNTHSAKNGVHALFIDFSKAFDLVDHGILLRKLAEMNVTKAFWLWTRSFLEDRRQQAKLAGTLSSVKPCPTGVPQGSVMSPALFNIRINDIENSIPDGLSINICKYADDCTQDEVVSQGITVDTRAIEEFLTYQISIPARFKGKTAGLLGFWDDSKDQEFLLPNGSFIHTNSSYRKLHNEFGQKCKF